MLTPIQVLFICTYSRQLAFSNPIKTRRRISVSLLQLQYHLYLPTIQFHVDSMSITLHITLPRDLRESSHMMFVMSAASVRCLSRTQGGQTLN